jgi:hypothetical protein
MTDLIIKKTTDSYEKSKSNIKNTESKKYL